ncbi:uncharacterized protein VTP21DRAFT_7379 [Calcarisporiella thermophila]|uniref:uncharacterized protein n=1 Tax=Calcarisporiella thermophila TaxID=911321 RepID=UPI003742BEC7
MSDPFFEGNVNEAVALATANKCLFLTLIYDDSQESQQTLQTFSSQQVATRVKSDTVALKLKAGTSEAIMFSQIFPVTNVPCVYMIHSGVVKDMFTGVLGETEVVERIDRAIGTQQDESIENNAGYSGASNSREEPTLMNNSPNSSLSSIPSPASSSVSTPLSSSIAASTEQRPSHTDTEKLKKQIEERRKQREIEEREQKRVRELKRREEGRSLQEARKQQQELENKKLAAELKKQRQEDKEARRRVLEQLAADKAERAAMRQAEIERRQRSITPEPAVAGPSGKSNKENNNSSGSIHDYSNINIRLLDGSTLRNKFSSSETLGGVRAWLEENRTDGSAPFILMQTFPNRNFTMVEEGYTLRDLNLTPSATLICKPTKNITNAYTSNSSWGLLSSGYSLISNGISLVTGYVFGSSPQKQSEENRRDQDYTSGSDSECEREKKTPRRRAWGARVATLYGDSEDERERVTYNGNSTNQQ